MAAPMSFPKHELVFDDLSSTETDRFVRKLILDHPFNHGVDIFVPGSTDFSNHLKNAIQDQFTYHVDQVHLSTFLSPEFIGAFVQKGHLYMLSQGTHIDQDDCAAILPNGELILKLRNDTYHELGLDGQLSQYAKKSKERYVVKVKLTEPCFKPGKKHFEKVKRCLNGSKLKMEFLVTWVPFDNKICSSSIGAYFKNLGHPSKLCKTTVWESSESCVLVPVVRSDYTENQSDCCGPQQLHEYLGARACGVDCPAIGEDDQTYVSSFRCPTPYILLPSVYQGRLRGYLTMQSIIMLYEHLREMLDKVPWVSLTVHGFHDSPVSWHNKEHGYLFHGDNTFTVVLFKNMDSWTFRVLASYDTLY